MDKFFTDYLKVKPRVGANVMNAAEFTLDYDLGEYPVEKVNELLATLANGSQEDRNAFAAALTEPILQMVPYATLYDRFFMDVTLTDRDDPALPVEDQLVSVSYASHPQTGVFFVRPGYSFYRPTFNFFTGGFEIPWNLMSKAGWNVLQRQMNYVVWDLAKKQDAVAKSVVDAAIPTTHQASVTGDLTKTVVDNIIRSSNQIGFPVRMALINPGRLMSMQSWTWGGTGFFIPPTVAQELLDNLFISNYGNLRWYASPYVPVNSVYFAGAPEQIGWHETRGTPRQDSAVNIKLGVDEYTLRTAEHAYYAQSGLTLWSATIL